MKNRYMPLLMAICVVIGIVIGTFYANHFSGNRLNIINSGSNRLNNLLHIIDDQYVDTVNINDLVEKAIPQILSELDPHSVYISAKDAQNAADDLKGSFFGVGIEFIIPEDTILVQEGKIIQFKSDFHPGKEALLLVNRKENGYLVFLYSPKK